MVILKPRAGTAGRLSALLAAVLLLGWGTAGFPQEPAPAGTPAAEDAPYEPVAEPSPSSDPAPSGPATLPEAPPRTATEPPQSQPEAEKEPPPPPRPRPRKPKTLQQKHDDLERRISALAPRGTYLLIDTGINRLYLVRGGKVLREAVCSTGSGRFLPDPPRNREWTFDTPKGEFRIQKKIVNPVWVKPDWAFIEEGEPLPKSVDERVAPDELGDYAMDLGDGYLIHGTLYERSLGMSVTHGCVRVGAKDLDVIFHAVRVGTPVYIF
jgi:lipoprotein-anchoring transpeptidase ErfK/SrfK